MGRRKRPAGLGIPPGVVKNLLFLNLLICLTLLFTAFGLHYFLRPRALPTLAGAAGGESASTAGILSWWELETGRAVRLLLEGLPILKRNANP
ncbi:MAG TPA: hypothetical protein VIL83_01550 [Capillibacterium sp.]